MKKLLSIMLALVLCLSLAACTSGKEEKSTTDVASVVNSLADNTSGEEEKTISRGTLNGNVYSSEFLGIKFTKPDSWIYSSDEQIASVMNVGMDMLDANEFAKKATELASVYDMMAVDSSTGNNISITYENLKMSGSTDISYDDYIANLKNMMGNLSAITSVGFEEASTIDLGSQEFTKLAAHVSYGNVDCDQVYYLKKVGNYMAIIILTVMDGTDETTYEAMFS